MASATLEPEQQSSTDRRGSADPGLGSRVPRPSRPWPGNRSCSDREPSADPPLRPADLDRRRGGRSGRSERNGWTGLRPCGWLGSFYLYVVLIDLSMPTVDGISATRQIRAAFLSTQVVVTSGVDEDTVAVEAIRAGAAAYLLKDARNPRLVADCSRGGGMGQVALPARMAARMVRPGGGQGRPAARGRDRAPGRAWAGQQAGRAPAWDHGVGPSRPM